MKKILILTLVLAILLVSACSKSTDSSPNVSQSDESNNQNTSDTPSTDDKEKEPVIAPDFELEDLDGNMVKLSDFQGKKVIINFWATWCGYCVKEMPDLMKLQDEYKDDLVVLYVNVGEAKEDVTKFIEKEGLTGKIVLDTKQQTAMVYGVTSFPSTLAINEKGEVVTARIGMMSYEMMKQMYEML